MSVVRLRCPSCGLVVGRCAGGARAARGDGGRPVVSTDWQAKPCRAQKWCGAWWRLGPDGRVTPYVPDGDAPCAPPSRGSAVGPRSSRAV
jgi:hypothetical protein